MVRLVSTVLVSLALAPITATSAGGVTHRHALASHERRASTVPSGVDEGTERGGAARDGWYPEATLLTPSNVTGDSFGLLHDVPVVGQVYAQPVMDGSEVVVATEQNWVYGIDPLSGATHWAVQVGASQGAQPFNDISPSSPTLKSWECDDLEPYVGITSTPVVDPSTGIIYLVSLEQFPNGSLGYYVHALNPTNGSEEPNFPVEVGGVAQNSPSVVFNAYDELQRVALTLTEGVVYFGFSSHCDTLPYQGFVAGVSTSGTQTALWSDVLSPTGAGGGIWQGGGGFASDAPGELLLASGNGKPGTSPAGDIPGSSPPQTGTFGESLIRLRVQPDGTLKATDFFTPYDATALDTGDLDFGSGSPILLPPEFGTATTPNLVLAAGKEGYVYLFNAKSLGGVSPGNQGALAEEGPSGGAWATPGVWPGNGGYVYLPTANGGTQSLGNAGQGDFNVFRVDKPSSSSASFHVTFAGKGPEAVGFGTSSPIVTSDGLRAGSAVVWIVDHENGGGAQAELQAYNAVPRAGGSGTTPTLSLLGEWPVGNAIKFTNPGVGDNRLFVPTKGGQLLIFGLHASSALHGSAVRFGPTAIGSSQTRVVHLVTRRPLTITTRPGQCGVCSDTSDFSATIESPVATKGVVRLSKGEALTVRVTFRPTGSPGVCTDVLRVVSSTVEQDFPLSGTARAPTAWVVASSQGVTLPAYFLGSATPSSSSVTFTNFGLQSATVTGLTLPPGPFSVSGAPTVGSSIAPGEAVHVTVSLASALPGSFVGALTLLTDSPTADPSSTISLSGVASPPPVISTSAGPGPLQFGSSGAPVAVSGVSVRDVTVSNTGGSPLLLSASTSSPEFIVADLSGAIDLPPGATYELRVEFVPAAASEYVATLTLSSPEVPPQTLALTGFASGAGSAVAGPSANDWTVRGAAKLHGATLVLTPNAQYSVGNAFLSTTLATRSLVVNYTSESLDGSGGDGTALVLADATNLPGGSPPALGPNGKGYGLGPGTSLAVVLGEGQTPGTTSTSWVALSDGVDHSSGDLSYVGSPVNLPISTQDTANDVTVAITVTSIEVYVDGLLEISAAYTLPSDVRVGFSASTGQSTNLHLVSGVSIVVGD